MARRYAPYGAAMPDLSLSEVRKQEPQQVVFHGPVAFINGGPSDIGYTPALDGYENVKNVVALFAYQDVGHYPATFREPNGGAFAQAVDAWLDWQLKGKQPGKDRFVGPTCGLCKDSKWHIQIKNVP
jgi:hypothetical protein